MRILWVSNAPWAPTGYGVQTKLFTDAMTADGWEVFVYANYGLHGAAMRQPNGTTILPASHDRYGMAMLPYYHKRYEPDLVICLFDIWVLAHSVIDSMPFVAYSPVDHDPIPPRVYDALSHCSGRLAMSRFAEDQMRKVSLPSIYAPHAINRETYYPADRDQARRSWGFTEHDFLCVIVAANKGEMGRKGFKEAFAAWGKFIQEHKNAHLYVHAIPRIENGIDLPALARFHEIPDENLSFADHGHMEAGIYSPDRMAALYNAADALLAPSMGEGFGVPVIEAQACGCPVIVSDFTAQSELCGAGWKIQIDPDDLYYTAQQSTMCLPRVSRILSALKSAYVEKNNEELRGDAASFAEQYDIKRVWENHMRPALESLAKAEYKYA